MLYSIRKYQTHAILVVIASIPLLLWISEQGASTLTTSIGVFVASLGKAAALSGIALYCFMPIMSMRHKITEKIFGGLDNAYRLHAKTGKISFYLIILHPLLLGLGRFTSGSTLAHVWDWSSLVVSIGIFAFIGLIIITGITIYAHITHQSWIIIHRLFGWLIPVYFAHALLARGQITKIQPLLAYLLVLGVLGFLAFLYRSVFAKHLVKRSKYEVAEVRHVTDSVTELTLKPINAPMHYRPGQFAFLSVDSLEVDPEPHPFSFTTADNGPYIRFAIKSLGDDTEKFKRVAPGEVAYLEGPYGTFNYQRIENKKQIWIAGGVGITPFLSMARSLGDNKDNEILLFYAAEKLTDAVFLQEIIDIKRHIPHNFDVTIVDKNVSGFVNVGMISKEINRLSDYDFMICGPPGMMMAMKKGLHEAGIPDQQIHIEQFSM